MLRMYCNLCTYINLGYVLSFLLLPWSLEFWPWNRSKQPPKNPESDGDKMNPCLGPPLVVFWVSRTRMDHQPSHPLGGAGRACHSNQLDGSQPVGVRNADHCGLAFWARVRCFSWYHPEIHHGHGRYTIYIYLYLFYLCFLGLGDRIFWAIDYGCILILSYG